MVIRSPGLSDSNNLNLDTDNAKVRRVLTILLKTLFIQILSDGQILLTIEAQLELIRITQLQS